MLFSLYLYFFTVDFKNYDAPIFLSTNYAFIVTFTDINNATLSKSIYFITITGIQKSPLTQLIILRKSLALKTIPNLLMFLWDKNIFHLRLSFVSTPIF